MHHSSRQLFKLLGCVADWQQETRGLLWKKVLWLEAEPLKSSMTFKSWFDCKLTRAHNRNPPSFD